MKENQEEKDTTLLIKNEEKIEKDENEEQEEEEEEEIEEEIEREEKDDENYKKVDDEKTGLLRIVKRLEKDFESEKYSSLNQIYESYIDTKDSIKNIIKPNTKRCSLIFMFYVVSPIFGIITLIGIFESIAMMKIIFEVLKNSFFAYFYSLRKEYDDIIKFSIYDFNNKYNFYYMFFEQVKKESYDFNIMMFFSFLGEALLKATEFRVSIVVFGLVIGLAILNILTFSFLNYDINDNTYSFLKIVSLFIIWLVLFIAIGASALLPQQVIIDSNVQYNKYLIKLNEETEKKRDEIKEKFDKQKTLKGNDFVNDKKKHITNTNEENEKSDKKNDENKELKEREKNKDNEYFEKMEKKDKKNKFDSFFMICLIAIIGYLLKYLINIILIDRNEEKNLEKYMNITNCINDTICFEKIISDKNLSITNFTLFSNLKNEIYEDSYSSFIFIVIVYGSSVVLSICLYSIFVIIFTKIEDIKQENKEENKQENKEENKEENKYEKKEENKDENEDEIKDEKKEEKMEEENNNENNNKTEEKIEKKISHKICEIFGCACYCESINLNDHAMNCCAEKFQLCIFTLCSCFQLVYKSFCNYLYKMFCFCQPTDDDLDLDYSRMQVVFKKNNECFCYCYQTKRLQFWIHEYLTSDVQKEIFPLMIEYFILKLLTIAFEKQYFNSIDNEQPDSHTNHTNVTNYTSYFDLYQFSSEIKNYTENIDNFSDDKPNVLKLENIYTLIVFIGTFILFFYFTLSFEPVINNFKDDPKYFRKRKLVKTMKLSKRILTGTHGILIFDGFYALIFTSLYLSNNENIIFSKNYIYLVPVLMNKFYYFTLIYYCISYSEQKKKFDLISGSTLISVYLFILELITSSIRDSSPLKSLYITQLVFACLFPCLIFVLYCCTFLIYMICKPIKLPYFIIFTMCFCSYIFCFGGFYWWNFQLKLEEMCVDENENCKCDCSKCSCNCCKESSICLCCFDFLNFFRCFNCCNNSCCNCCTCCECYDCCHCCSCCYCCGDKCSCNCC